MSSKIQNLRRNAWVALGVLAVLGLFSRRLAPFEPQRLGVAAIPPRLPPPAMAAESGQRFAREPGAGLNAHPLFTYVEIPEARRIDEALPAPAREIHYVRVDRAWLGGKSSPFWQPAGEGRITVPLPRGGSVVVAVAASEMLGPDRWTSQGQIEGRPASRALFAWSEGFLHATIEDPVFGQFTLRVATAEWSQFFRVDPTLVPPCGGVLSPRRAAGVGATDQPLAGGVRPPRRRRRRIRSGRRFTC